MVDERYYTTITKSSNAPSTNAPSTNAPSTNAPSTNAISTNAPSFTKSNIDINLLDFKDKYKYILKTRLR